MAGATAPVAPPPAAQQSTALRDLGRAIFFDRSLSASGRMACASCHDPRHAYGPPNARPVQLGGPDLGREGSRAVPSLRYVLNRTPVWFKEYVSNPVERAREGNEPPAGGFGWDGRFDSLRAQARFPLFAPNEMANHDEAALARRLRAAAYADALRRAFGAGVFDDPRRAVDAAIAALERFQLDDASFHPYTSRYDRYLDGRASLSEQELRGLRRFEDPQAGNCASCHPDRKGADGTHPLFTDYQFEALGVPRNQRLAANRDPSYFDLGVCGPLRHDQAAERSLCGFFKTPSLRNVARRPVLFHNGAFDDLREALRFYVRRDTDPTRWYPHAGGVITKFDDLPAALRVNVDVTDLPLTRKPGEPPVWSEADISDVIAFLHTLDDADQAGP